MEFLIFLIITLLVIFYLFRPTSKKELKKFKENLASLEVEKELPPEERLAALRVELISRRLDGFVVPLSDEYQSEFPPSHSQRLAWLTGFTGSAGMAVVLQKSAAILVDGRYSIQVRKQTNPKFYEPLDFSGGALKEWLKTNAKDGARIGFDPWLHSQSGFAALKKKFSFSSGVSVSTSDARTILDAKDLTVEQGTEYTDVIFSGEGVLSNLGSASLQSLSDFLAEGLGLDTTFVPEYADALALVQLGITFTITLSQIKF